MRTQRLIKSGSFVVSSLLGLGIISISILAISFGIVMLGHFLSYLATHAVHGESMTIFQYILVVLATTCTAGLAVPILILARDIQKSTEHFSLLQFDEEDEEDDEYDEEDDLNADDEELNEFLRKLHKSRNIGPFIPSPKTMDDLCPCGSGLKYKDCCGKLWS